MYTEILGYHEIPEKLLVSDCREGYQFQDTPMTINVDTQNVTLLHKHILQKVYDSLSDLWNTSYNFQISTRVQVDF